MHQQNPAFVPLTKQAVADMLGISVRSVENWVNEAILPAPAKLGNRVYWHPDVFFGWLSQRLQEAFPELPQVPSKPAGKKSRNSGSDSVAALRAGRERKLARLQASL